MSRIVHLFVKVPLRYSLISSIS